jgi:hypothetical protein
MFTVLTDLSLLLRKEFDLSTYNSYDVLVSGVTGVWVTLDSSGTAIRTSSATKLAWPVWNESSRAGTVGWTPDVSNSKKVTTLMGKFFATTDQYSGVTVCGPLVTGANGKLVPGTESVSTNVVAYCIKAPYSKTHLGTTFTVIDIYVCG